MILVHGAYLAQGDIMVGVLAAFLRYLRQSSEQMQEISQFSNTFGLSSLA